MNKQAQHEDFGGSVHPGDREQAALLWRMEQTGHRIAECHEAALSAYGLSRAQLGVLKHLVQANEPLALGRLAARLTCGKSNITQLVDRMERAGLVQRVPDAEDRRCLRAAITEEGKRRYALGIKAEAQIEQQLLASFSRREQKDIAELLVKFNLGGS